MSFFILFIFYILFSTIQSNYYVTMNSTNYSLFITVKTDIINDFNNLFPLKTILIDNENKGYFKLGKSNSNNNLPFTNSSIKKGDLVLLEDNSYALFYTNRSYISHIYIGYVIDYNLNFNENNNILNSYWFTNNEFQINENPNCNKISLYGDDVYIDFGCNKKGKKCKKETEITIMVKGNYFLRNKPSIYLNSKFLSDDCRFQDNNRSLLCTIGPSYYPGKLEKEHKFYKMEVKEYIPGCDELVNIGMNIYLNNFYIIYVKYLIFFSLLLL